jgi:hypothetical protein
MTVSVSLEVTPSILGLARPGDQPARWLADRIPVDKNPTHAVVF